MAEGIEIYAHATPNPNSVKFATNRTLAQKNLSYTDAHTAEEDPLARKIFEVPGVQRIFIASNSITVTRQGGVDWRDLVPCVVHIIQQHFEDSGD